MGLLSKTNKHGKNFKSGQFLGSRRPQGNKYLPEGPTAIVIHRLSDNFGIAASVLPIDPSHLSTLVAGYVSGLSIRLALLSCVKVNAVSTTPTLTIVKTRLVVTVYVCHSITFFHMQ